MLISGYSRVLSARVNVPEPPSGKLATLNDLQAKPVAYFESAGSCGCFSLVLND